MPRSTMLPGGGAICAKVSFTSREGPFCATTGASAPCTPGITCPTCGFCSVWAATAGSALISGCVAGVACVMKEGNALIPIATAQIQNSFLFIALSSLLSQSLIRWLCRFAPLRAARNKRYNPGNQRSQHTEYALHRRRRKLRQMAVATEAELQNIQQTFQRLIFRVAVLSERPCIRTGKRTLH